MLKHRVITDQEVVAILAEARAGGPADELLAELAVTHGMRPGEIATLRLDSVENDPEDPEGRLLRSEGKAPRTLTLSNSASQALARHITSLPEREGALFSDTDTTATIVDRIDRILADAGLPRGVHGPRLRLVQQLHESRRRDQGDGGDERDGAS
ncbi:site-specific integrase [Kitasatospora sp. NBC_01560]|uniref:tyrosine-type recombinase/integrase n=1 Tax=Kitasatospora sp. NBC_01560 TaxID=2975965 RepID=UPI0038655069